MSTEADTCRKFVVPLLQAAGWDDEPHSIAEQRWFTHRQRADRVKRQQTAFFNYFAPEAREILNDLLKKYAADGELQFTLPDVLKLPPISQHANVAEIIGIFGGAEQRRNAVNQLQTLLYAA
jgi:type I restriction enzyme, R subunit